MSDILIVYYSRTGRTRLVARRLAETLKVDAVEIEESKDRSGMVGYLLAGWDTMLKRPSQLKSAPDAGAYPLVVLGMPVWAFQPPPPIRAFVQSANLAGKTVCAFCTLDGSGHERTFAGLNAILPAPLASTFYWKKPRENDPALESALTAWAASVRGLLK